MELPRGPHRRFDPLTGEWVLVSAGRTQRPWLGRREGSPQRALPAYDPDCYLCPGNLRASGARNPAYERTFVFTNDFAALRPDTPEEHVRDGLLIAETEPGTCRVLCFSPRHDLTLSEMEDLAVRAVIDVWAEQSAELGGRYRWVQVFENRGEAMGASNPHPHGQIWAGAALPREAEREGATQRRHLETHARPLLIDVAEQELGGPRSIDADDEWLTLVPFWAAWPYETLLLPRRPAARLPDLDESQRTTLTWMLQRLMRRYDALFDLPMPFSMGWHQAPFDEGPTDHWQLHAHFLPPLLGPTVRKFMVGYELLSEPQRDITAEDAAKRLRAADPGEPAQPAGATLAADQP
jgi:UDPglucose--hexose-1-phosphate uridylyltransferase